MALELIEEEGVGKLRTIMAKEIPCNMASQRGQ